MKIKVLKDYKIDYNELESCMIKLLGIQEAYNLSTMNRATVVATYLTTSGRNISGKFVDGKDIRFLNHTQMSIITIRCYLDGKSEKERGFIKKQFPWIPYNNFVEWGGMYENNISDNIEDYLKIKPSVEVNNDFPFGVPDDSIWSAHNINVQMLKESRGVRLNYHMIPSGASLNIETCYPLTHSQRSFLLDIIKFYRVSDDNIYVDDHTLNFNNKTEKWEGKMIPVIEKQLGIRR